MPKDADLAETNPADALCEQERQVYDLLSDTPIHFDDLHARTKLPVGDLSASLTMLELAELAKGKGGNWFVRRAPKPTSQPFRQGQGECELTNPTVMLISAFLKLASSHWRGISRRFLQKYLALFWCHIDRMTWHGGALLEACLRFGKVSRHQLRNYVTPLLVKIFPYP